MRLTMRQRKEVLEAVSECFGPDATVRLFGSRTDDAARGGDIDLFITTDKRDVAEIARAEIRLQVALQQRLDEQKIDLLIDYPGRTDYPPIFEVAARTGVAL